MLPLKIGEKYLIRDQRGQPTINVTVRDDSDKKNLESLRTKLRVRFIKRIVESIRK